MGPGGVYSKICAIMFANNLRYYPCFYVHLSLTPEISFPENSLYPQRFQSKSPPVTDGWFASNRDFFASPMILESWLGVYDLSLNNVFAIQIIPSTCSAAFLCTGTWMCQEGARQHHIDIMKQVGYKHLDPCMTSWNRVILLFLPV